jgi:NADH-quinone oxidoreductase subunit L
VIQAIVFFPLVGALIAGLLGRIIGHRTSEYITTGLLIAAAVLSWIVFAGYWFAPEAAEGAGHAEAIQRITSTLVAAACAPSAASGAKR